MKSSKRNLININTLVKQPHSEKVRRMSSYKVTYFNGRGRGELTRLLMVTAGQDFEDERITREEWPKMKPSMYCFVFYSVN